MDIRARKKQFLETLKLTEIQHKAVSLAIDCLIENELQDEDTPLVVTSFDGYSLKCVLNAVRAFCNDQYPHSPDNYFEPSLLNINGRTSEDACLDLIRQLRRDSGMLYWADSSNWFSSLPTGLFHVIELNSQKATRGLNNQKIRNEIQVREYTDDLLLPEMFVNITHSNLEGTKDIKVAYNKLYDECHAGLIRAIPAPAGAKYDEKITICSPDWQKLACIAIRRYQSKECSDGMGWDISDEGWNDVTAHPFVESLPTLDGSGYRDCLVGLVTMKCLEGENPSLSTVWIHPFYRRRGFLKRLWSDLKDEYGDFKIEAPNSNMQAFIKAMDKSSME
ncbi:hypothetical protein Q4519_16970 [Motilimonas sp. 1_MG-2023]|uniref:hypothetical protein n=1 Tax=Motilimonas sp. 1_MG-2023 TaxID=3062672 RepID=UPI0026E42063|nr:hypothetical protein [Motilimonas sp. 1_MG-2023]MDO6527373.1 hypothetical protein [Motilimonas sp. 1_MG-2023]